MDQRPDFDEGQNDQEITNDEKLGLVEISFFGRLVHSRFKTEIHTLCEPYGLS